MKIFLDTIGCRLNQSEIEQMAYQFRSAGHQIIDSPVEADLVVVNTCAVTAAAASDSRQKIRLAARLGKASVVVTGCWGTLEPQAAHDLPGVEFVIPNNRKDTLVSEILGFPVEAFDIEPIAREPLPGSHARTRAFIKVQDGCDNHCTFCITRIARGPGRSRAVDEVIKDVKMAQNGNTQEIVLSGVHLGSWGHDFDQPDHLRHLIEEILNRTSIPRVRLSSLEPWDLDHDFFELWSNPRLCRHLHLPLQSGAVKTLKRMARNTTPDAYLALVTEVRKMQPDMAITTDIIVGYPGESDEDHQESLEFVRKVGFAGGHVFTYSKREGTAAAKLGEQVNGLIRKKRGAEMRALFAETSFEYKKNYLGEKITALWETAEQISADTWRLSGLSDNYLRVDAISKQNRRNRIDQVYLKEFAAEHILGIIED